MSSSSNKSSSGGVGVCTVVGIVFLILKLTGLIDWSWWWVLAPFWIPIAGVITFIIIALLVKLIQHLFER